MPGRLRVLRDVASHVLINRPAIAGAVSFDSAIADLARKRGCMGFAYVLLLVVHFAQQVVNQQPDSSSHPCPSHSFISLGHLAQHALICLQQIEELFRFGAR